MFSVEKVWFDYIYVWTYNTCTPVAFSSMNIKTTVTAHSAVFITLLYIPTVLVFYFAFSEDYVPLEKYDSLRFVVLLLFLPIILKYIIQLFAAPLYSLVGYWQQPRGSVPYTPSVSVIIPAWNEEVGITKTIESVLRTNYPALEVIVVNDGSTDGTHDKVMALIGKHQSDGTSTLIRYELLPNGGKARALNAGIAVATGDIVVTVDADSVMHGRAIHNIVIPFRDPAVASVAGNVTIGNRRRSIGLVQQLEYLYGFYFKRADSLFNSVYIVGGAAAAYRRSVFAMVGSFDEDLITEDIEMSTRLQSFGYKVKYAHNSIVFTEGPSDFHGLCRQRLRWKFGRLLTFYKHRKLFFSLRPGHRFYLSFLILPIALFAELLLFFEGLLLAIFFTYTFYTNDFVPLAFVIVLLSGVIWIQILSDPNMRHHRNLLLVAPVAWLLFYFMDIVEYQALVRSLKRLITRKELVWQKWQRVGVFEDTHEALKGN